MREGLALVDEVEEGEGAVPGGADGVVIRDDPGAGEYDLLGPAPWGDCEAMPRRIALSALGG